MKPNKSAQLGPGSLVKDDFSHIIKMSFICSKAQNNNPLNEKSIFWRDIEELGDSEKQGELIAEYVTAK